MTDTTTPPDSVEPVPSPHGDEQCVQCEQTDNHPKVHVLQKVGEDLVFVSHHLDCLAHQHRAELIGSAPHMAQVFEAVLHRGLRGDALRQHIDEVHAQLPQAPYVTGPSVTAPAPTTDPTAAATGLDTTQGA